jgi:hypothetical protein
MMSRPMRTALFLVVVIATVPATAAKRRASTAPSRYPPCAMITGTAGVTFTHDFGASLTPSAESPRPIAYTYGVAVMVDDPGTLMAWHRDDLLISTDAGCSWRVVATNSDWDFPPQLTPGKGGRMYVWSDNRRFLLRYDSRGLHTLKQPVDFLGLAVSDVNGERLRAGGTDGTIWESWTAGDTWFQVGALTTDVPLYYRFAFDPGNLDHIVAGTVSNGAYVSRDGGRNWTRATGIGRGGSNIFAAVISPADPSRVWVEGIDLAESRRYIWVSSDGGATYQPVVQEGPGVELINGNIMAAHPTNKDILFFVFGTHIFDHGTDLYRFDLTSGELSVTHNTHDGINAIAFSPADATLMYLGIAAIN